MRPPIQAGADSRKNWIRINEIDAQVASIEVGLRSPTGKPDFRDQAVREQMHPFKLYRLPWRLRKNHSEEDWRKFRVRVGRVITNSVEGGSIVNEGTDGADNPDILSYPDVDDILVPADTLEYWFWIEVDPVTGHAIAVRHAADPAAIGAGWESFPNTDGLHFPIGFVDTSTRATDRVPIVRQLIRTDLVFAGSGDCI